MQGREQISTVYVHEIFEEQAVKYKDRNYFIWTENDTTRFMTYQQANEQVNCLVQYLRETLGLKKGSIVAVCLEEGPLLRLMPYACFKAHLVYMALPNGLAATDKESSKIAEELGLIKKYLQEAVNYGNCDKVCLLTSQLWMQQYFQKIQTEYQDRLVSITWQLNSGSSKFELSVSLSEQLVKEGLSPEDPAYIYASSGTTQQVSREDYRPKMMVLPHSGIYDRINGIRKALQIPEGHEGSLMGTCRCTFDPHLVETIAPMLCGASLALFPRDSIYQPTIVKKIVQKYQRKGIECHYLFTLPQILAQLSWKKLPDLKGAVTTGEKSAIEKLVHWMDDAFVLVDGYGPTEVTIGATATRIKRDIGPTLNNGLGGVKVYLVIEETPHLIINNYNHQPCVKLSALNGKEGEIYISGNGIGYYLNFPEKNKQKFTEIIDDSRAYKTGDVARIKDGHIFFIGRNELSMRHNGVWVFFDELEDKLKSIDGVASALVVSREGILIAVVVPESLENEENYDEQVSSCIREHAKIIDVCFKVEKLNNNTNGKLDRRIENLSGLQVISLNKKKQGVFVGQQHFYNLTTFQKIIHACNQRKRLQSEDIIEACQKLFGINLTEEDVQEIIYTEKDKLKEIGMDSLDITSIISALCKEYPEYQVLANYLYDFFYTADLGTVAKFIDYYINENILAPVVECTDTGCYLFYLPLIGNNEAVENIKSMENPPCTILKLTLPPDFPISATDAISKKILFISLAAAIRRQQPTGPYHFATGEEPLEKEFLAEFKEYMEKTGTKEEFYLSFFSASSTTVIIKNCCEKIAKQQIEHRLKYKLQKWRNRHIKDIPPDSSLVEMQGCINGQEENSATLVSYLKAFADNEDNSVNTLFLLGRVGAGKTTAVRQLVREQEELIIFLPFIYAVDKDEIFRAGLKQGPGLDDAEINYLKQLSHQQAIIFIFDDMPALDENMSNCRHLQKIMLQDNSSGWGNNIKLIISVRNITGYISWMKFTEQHRNWQTIFIDALAPEHCFSTSDEQALFTKTLLDSDGEEMLEADDDNEKEPALPIIPLLKTFISHVQPYATNYAPDQFRLEWLKFFYRRENTNRGQYMKRRLNFNAFLETLDAFFSEYMEIDYDIPAEVQLDGYWWTQHRDDVIYSYPDSDFFPHFLGSVPYSSLLTCFLLPARSQSTNLSRGWEQFFKKNKPLTTLSDKYPDIENPACFPRINEECIERLAYYPGTQPVFAFYPLTGEIPEMYRQIAKAQQRTFYALKMPEARKPDTISDSANWCYDIITRIQPTGPYFFMGWSFGGLLGFETALVFEAREKKINPLVIIDCVSPSGINGVSVKDRAIGIIMILIDIYKLDLPVARLKENLESLEISGKTAKQQIDMIFDQAFAILQEKYSEKSPRYKKVWEAFSQGLYNARLNLTFQCQYPEKRIIERSHKKLQADLLVFQAEATGYLGYEVAKDGNFAAWREESATGSCEVLLIEKANHFNIFNYEKFSEKFSDASKKYQGRVASESLQSRLKKYYADEAKKSQEHLSRKRSEPRIPLSCSESKKITNPSETEDLMEKIEHTVVYSEYPYIIIEGAPGAGKSCFIESFYQKMVSRYLLNTEYYCPLHINVKSGDNIINSINVILRNMGLTEQEIVDQAFFKDQLILILVDGYDELLIPEDIKELIAKNPECKIIFTCRNNLEIIGEDLHIDILYLQELSQKQIDLYIKQYKNLHPEIPDERWQILYEIARACRYKMFNNPLLLSIISNIEIKPDGHPRAWGELYEMCIYEVYRQTYEEVIKDMGLRAKNLEEEKRQIRKNFQAYGQTLACHIFMESIQLYHLQKLFSNESTDTYYARKACQVYMHHFGEKIEFRFLADGFAYYYLADALIYGLFQEVSGKASTCYILLGKLERQKISFTFLLELIRMKFHKLETCGRERCISNLRSIASLTKTSEASTNEEKILMLNAAKNASELLKRLTIYVSWKDIQEYINKKTVKTGTGERIVDLWRFSLIRFKPAEWQAFLDLLKNSGITCLRICPESLPEDASKIAALEAVLQQNTLCHDLNSQTGLKNKVARLFWKESQTCDYDPRTGIIGDKWKLNPEMREIIKQQENCSGLRII